MSHVRGQRVSIPKSGTGVVAFAGATAFAQGTWVGIVLDAPLGKNDGTVQGQRYFEAEPSCGVFVRPSQVTILEDEPRPTTPPFQSDPNPAHPISNARPTKQRLSSTPTAPRSATATLRTPSRPAIPRTSASASRTTTTTNTTSQTHIGTPRPALIAGSRPSSSASAQPSRRLSANAAKPQPISAALKRASNAGNAGSMAPPPVPPPSARRAPASATATATATASATAPTRRPAAQPLSLSKRGTSSSSTSAAARPSSAASSHSQSSARPSPSVHAPPLPPSPSPRKPATQPASEIEQQQGEGEGEGEEEEDDVLDGELPPDEDGDDPQSDEPPPQQQQDPFSLQSRSTKSQHSASQQAYETVPLRTHEELSTKHKILEARHAELRTRLSDLHTMKEEHASLVAAKPKYQQRILDLTEQVKDLKVALKENDKSAESIEEMQSQLEILSVDKEVAEEQAELVQCQLDDVKEQLAEVQVQCGVLKEALAKWEARVDGPVSEGQEQGDEQGDERSSLKVLQLERQNERLKEALSRLRDLTSENDAEHRRKVADMEKELELTRDLQDEFDVMQGRAETAEAQVEDLKVQLDDAFGAEDVLDQLTERNLTLSEQLEEARATVEDLEALKELNDELEENHVETEAQLLEELDMKDQVIQEQHRRSELLEESLVDYEGTVGQFRELVTSLQNDVVSLRKQQFTAESDAQSLTSQTQSMLTLNMKLQSTVSRTQIKTIELELRKLEAAQAIERLAITRPYLPAPFFEHDSDAVDALLFFDRLSRKTDLIGKTMTERHNIAESLTTAVPDGLVVICEARGKLARFSILTRRFAANLRRCSPEIFLRMGNAYKDILPIERRVDAYVEQIGNETLRETECSKELDKFIAHAGHMAEVNLGESGLDLGEMQLGQAHTIDLDLDTFVAGVGYTKQSIAVITKEPDVTIEPEDLSIGDEVFEPLQRLIEQARTAQNSARKIHRRMEELVQETSSLTPEAADSLIDLARTVHHLGAAGVRMSDLINRYLSEIRATRQPLQLSTLKDIVQEACTELDFKTSNVFVALDTEIALVNQRISGSLVSAQNPDLAQTVTFISPWSERVSEIATAAVVNIETEQRVVRLNEELKDMARELRSKDQSLQERSVKIELMDKRMETAKKQADQVIELEEELNKSRKDTKTFEQTIEELQKELEGLEKENVKLKGAAANAPAAPADAKPASLFPFASGTGPGATEEALAFTGSLETAQLLSHIEHLRSSLHFLRQENAFLKAQDLMSEFTALPKLPHAPSAAPLSSSPTPAPEHRQQTEATRALWKDALHVASTPKVVDLTAVDTSSKSWRSMTKRPEAQFERQTAAVAKLGARFKNLEMPSVARI